MPEFPRAGLHQSDALQSQREALQLENVQERASDRQPHARRVHHTKKVQLRGGGGLYIP